MSFTAALVCQTGALLCALPIADVIETMRPLTIQPLAGMPPFVLGLAVIRGLPTPVVALAGLLGHSQEKTPDGVRWIALRADDRSLALEVDEVRGVVDIPFQALQAMPSLLGEVNAAILHGVGLLDDQLLLLLRNTGLIAPNLWIELQDSMSTASQSAADP